MGGCVTSCCQKREKEPLDKDMQSQVMNMRFAYKEKKVNRHYYDTNSDHDSLKFKYSTYHEQDCQPPKDTDTHFLKADHEFKGCFTERQDLLPENMILYTLRDHDDFKFEDSSNHADRFLGRDSTSPPEKHDVQGVQAIQTSGLSPIHRKNDPSESYAESQHMMNLESSHLEQPSENQLPHIHQRNLLMNSDNQVFSDNLTEIERVTEFQESTDLNNNTGSILELKNDIFKSASTIKAQSDHQNSVEQRFMVNSFSQQYMDLFKHREDSNQDRFQIPIRPNQVPQSVAINVEDYLKPQVNKEELNEQEEEEEEELEPIQNMDFEEENDEFQQEEEEGEADDDERKKQLAYLESLLELNSVQLQNAEVQQQNQQLAQLLQSQRSFEEEQVFDMDYIAKLKTMSNSQKESIIQDMVENQKKTKKKKKKAKKVKKTLKTSSFAGNEPQNSRNYSHKLSISQSQKSQLSSASKGADKIKLSGVRKKVSVGEKKNNYWMIPADILKEKYAQQHAVNLDL